MNVEENILEMRKIDKIFPGVKALDGVDFNVKKGEVHCLIGANGAGKSTLMKVLSAAYKQDSGEICFDGKILEGHNTQMRRKAGISVIYQELSLFDELTVAENIYINNYKRDQYGKIDWKQTYADAQALADKLNIRVKATDKVSDLNIGQRQLTELMKALAFDTKLIVMDEPSSTLSKTEFEILVRVIKDVKEHGVTVIYISHHLEELFTVGDRVTVLRDGKLVVCKELSEITEDILVEYMTGVNISKIKQDEIQVSKISEEKILEIKNLHNYKVSNINMEVHKGEVVGLYGLVGAGRTEIIESLYGRVKVRKGEILLRGKPIQINSPSEAIRNGIGLAPENRKEQGLVLKLPVWENMAMVAMPKLRRGKRIDYALIRKKCNEYVDKLKIKTPNIDTIANNLSGGNQQKIILAKWLMEDCDLLILDEPTQGIDVLAKEEIYKLIRNLSDKGKSIIIISSELQELLRLCDHMYVMYDGQQVMSVDKCNFNEDQILHASVSGRKTNE